MIKVEESEGDVEYQVSLLLARGDRSATSEGFESYGFSRLRDLMVRSSADAFTLDWTPTVPGEIIDGNADSVEGGVARWRLDLQWGPPRQKRRREAGRRRSLRKAAPLELYFTGNTQINSDLKLESSE